MDSWSCIACGGCCSDRFSIILTSYEYAKLSKSYGFQVMYMDRRGNPCLKKVRGRCVFQDSAGLCTLQPLGMKPMACRMWPFTIRREPIPGCGDALFQYGGEDYYVYVDRSYRCPGIGRGKPEELHSTIAELIEIRRNPSKQQQYSTRYE